MWHSRYMCFGIFLADVNCIKVVYESRFPSIKTIEIDSGNSLLRKCSFGHSSLKHEQESDELFGRYLISQQSDNLFDCLLADPRYKLNEWRVQSNKVHIDRELACYNTNFFEQRRRPSLQEGVHQLFIHWLCIIPNLKINTSTSSLFVYLEQRTLMLSIYLTSTQSPIAIIITFSVSEMAPSGTLESPPTQAHLSSRFSI